MGTILVATSVGITARVLSDIKKLDTPEGVTILGGAVVDDVLGIIVLTVVVALTRSADSVTPGQVAMIFVKAAGFWIALMVIGILSGKRFTKVLRRFRSEGSILALGLAVCFIVAAVAELGAGLAMIIGAYTVGLALSPTDLAHYLEERIAPIYHFLVPVFFVVMGMMVDFRATLGLHGFAMVACVVAFLTKVLGCGLPSLLVGFNLRGAWRIGLGMLPRGEVALIVAGVGIASGAIGKDIYGVAVVVTLVTTLAAPILLVPAFRGPEGRQRSGGAAGGDGAPGKD
jgi:Kef-type K+ transport system membrane component KefB